MWCAAALAVFVALALMVPVGAREVAVGASGEVADTEDDYGYDDDNYDGYDDAAYGDENSDAWGDFDGADVPEDDGDFDAGTYDDGTGDDLGGFDSSAYGAHDHEHGGDESDGDDDMYGGSDESYDAEPFEGAPEPLDESLPVWVDCVEGTDAPLDLAAQLVRMPSYRTPPCTISIIFSLMRVLRSHAVQPAVFASLGVASESGVTAFWKVLDVLSGHLADIYAAAAESAPPDGPLLDVETADPVGELIFDAILLDGASRAGLAEALAKPRFKSKARKLVRAMRRLNLTQPGATAALGPAAAAAAARQRTAQTDAACFLHVLAGLLGAMHSRWRAVPSARIASSEDGGPAALRGLVCLFAASGREPFEDAYGSPRETSCLALASDEPAELFTIGNVFCTSALAAKAQLAAVVEAIEPSGGEASDATALHHLPAVAQRWRAAVEAAQSATAAEGTTSQPPPLPPQLDDKSTAALLSRTEKLLREYDVATFSIPDVVVDSDARVPTQVT